ncbi:hypothetical protein L1987_88144 [Smallanthus sonchifolius]|nr:hypothetical protein L1987_88184 [Smallanthus sonchifolius]KAI3668850.1 hypothetical protein L1987_88144 [Smallanthus sonchifolius]
MYIAVPAEILGIILPLLLGVAFLVLAERKVMAFVQRRKGPDVVGSFGLLQPLADGFKLIIKEPISPSSANFSLFRMAPVATFMLSLVARAVVPFDYGMVLSDPNIGLLYLFAISSLGVYGIIIAGGWALTNTTVKPDPAFAPSASSGPHFLTQLTQTLASRHFARLGRKATDGSESQNTNKIRKAIIRANKAMASVRAKPKMA